MFCCFRGAPREPSPDPFAGIAAEQERSRRSLRLLSRDLRYGGSQASTASARALDPEELQHAVAERLLSREGGGSGARSVSDVQSLASAGASSLRSSVRSSVRAPIATGDGAEWIDHAWDSLVKGRVINDVLTAPSLDDDELSFRSLAVAMQSQVVGAGASGDGVGDDFCDAPRSGGSWASSRSGSVRSDSSGGSLTRLQMLAEDPFLEDLSLDNLSLHSHTPRSAYEERYYSPPVSARAQDLTFAQPSASATAGFLEEAPSPPYSVDLNRVSSHYRSRQAVARGSPAGVPRSPGESDKSDGGLSADAAGPGKLRLEDILGRVEGLARSASASSGSESAPAARAYAADEAWPHPPLGAPLDDCIVDSSSGEDDGNMYSDAPSDAGPVGSLRPAARRSAGSSEHSFSSESETESDTDPESEHESSASSASSSSSDSSLNSSEPERAASPPRMKKGALSPPSVDDGESLTGSHVSRPAIDLLGTEFSYITDEHRSVGGRSAGALSSGSQCGRDCELGFAPCAQHTVPVGERPGKGDLHAMESKRSRAEKRRSLVADAKVALARAADVKFSVVRNKSLPLEATKTAAADPTEDESPSVANLRRMWSERARG